MFAIQMVGYLQGIVIIVNNKSELLENIMKDLDLEPKTKDSRCFRIVIISTRQILFDTAKCFFKFRCV